MKKITIFFTYLLIFSLVTQCKSDDDSALPIMTPPVDEEPTANVEVYEPDFFENSLVLAVENGANSSFLVNKLGEKVHEWTFEDNLGNDLELLPNGQLIGMFKSESPVFSFGGFGGIIKLINPDGSIDWEYEHASATYLAHHDVEYLPNGNVLFLSWEEISSATAQQAGVNTTGPIYPEVLVEVNPDTNAIVWEWHSWDHIVQDFDSNLPNFGDLNTNPDRININYNIIFNGDSMHANGIDVDATNDVIYMSVNGYSEIWVIDHSTTTMEAASNIGGNYNKGGRLLYRFGNPETYNSLGSRLFYNNHFPNLLEGNEPGAGNVLVYMNGNNFDQTIIYELDIPDVFNLQSNTNNEPTIAWEFLDTDLFYDRISGAVRLANGNTLICEGDYGLWEVTPNKDIVWKYNSDTNLWRCYGYASDSEAITNLGL